MGMYYLTTKKEGATGTHRPSKIPIKLLHLGKGNCTGCAYTGAGLAALAKISLLCECLAVLHHKNADRTVIYALFTTFAF
jgi:hypothetical protein